jgi:hypothetical protein
VLTVCRLHSNISIVIADLSVDSVFLDDQGEQYYSDMLFDTLYAKASDKDYSYIQARTVGNNNVTDWKVKNEIEAFAVIENIDLNYLVYGNITSSNNNYESTFKIYSKKDERVLKTIVYKNTMEDRKTFIKETSFKIDIAVYELLKPDLVKDSTKLAEDIDKYNRNKDIKDRIKDFRFFEYLGFNFSVGYAVPCGDWSNLFFGIIDVETGIKVVRLPFLYSKSFFNLAIRPGFTFAYTLSKNKIEVVEEYSNSFSFRFPAEILFIFNNKYILNANFDVHVRVDSYYQNLYNIRKNYYTTTTFGWSTGLGFEYEIDKSGIMTVGLNNFMDFAIYDIFYFDYKIQTYLLIKIKEKKKSKKINVDEIKIRM